MNRSYKNSDLERTDGTHQPVKVFSSGKPFILLDHNAIILDCNEAFVNLFGISKKQLLTTDLNLFAPNTLFIEALRKAAAEGISLFKGRVVFGTNLLESFIDSALFNIETENHSKKGISCYIISIAFIAPALKNRDINNVPGIPHQLSASVSVHASNGNAIYISPSTEILLGYSRAELMELDSLNPVYTEDIPIVMNVIEKLNSGYDFLNSRYRMVHKNGSVISVETASYLINDVSGTGKHIVNITWDVRSQAKIERALALSEQKYYRLVMNLPVGVSLISRDGQLVEANDAIKKIMRISLSSSLPELNFFGNSVMKRTGISEKLSKCIAAKEIVNGELPFNTNRRGREQFLSYSFLPILDNAGNVESVIGYVNDLTDQKRAESNSRERADFLNLVINAITLPFFVKDEDHKWVMLNDAAIDMMGQPREALLGKSDYDLFPKEQADVFWKYDELLFKTGSNSNEEQITWNDGTIHTIVTNKQLYIEKPSGKKFIVGTNHDISGYKKIEDELRASEMKYRELFNNANDFIITLEVDGKITNANRTLLNYLQTDFESFVNHNVFDFFTDENKEYAYSMRDKVLSGTSENSFEVEAIGLNGQAVFYEVKASLIWQNEKIVGLQCIFSDVTERREASSKLEEYSKNLLELNNTKDKFFNIIAHDLRNPYSSILGFSELLYEDLDDMSKDEIRDLIKIIHNSAKNSLNLLENLLAWSRLETGRIPFDLSKVVLTDIIDEVIDVLFSLAYRKKIEIANTVEPDISLFADKNMMTIILNNLIMNAIKYTPIGGKISIYTGELFVQPGTSKEFITIRVADTGIGMDPSVIDKLFTLNKPQSSPGTENEQGTGLGLLLSREMVEKHGGSIAVESVSGKGSVFSFSIPIYKPEDDIQD